MPPGPLIPAMHFSPNREVTVHPVTMVTTRHLYWVNHIANKCGSCGSNATATQQLVGLTKREAGPYLFMSCYCLLS
jgi:hypothetical protein